MSAKLTYEYVYNYFKDNGCVLLEDEYIKNSKKMKYRCVCDNISYISFNKFKMGRRCKECKKSKLSDMHSFSYDYVYNFFRENDCTLLSTEYKNCDSLLDYTCNCGNPAKISFYHFKQGQRCKKCKYEKMKDDFKHSQKYVESVFLNRNCELLESTYKNNKTKMKYRCACGNISYIRFDSFLLGGNCGACKSNKMLGECNPSWNPDRTSVRTREHLQNLSNSYKQKYRKIHNVVGSNYHIDHIFPVKAFVEHGIYDLDIINDSDNFQILSAVDNLKKSSKYDKPMFYKFLESKGLYLNEQSKSTSSRR